MTKSRIVLILFFSLSVINLFAQKAGKQGMSRGDELTGVRFQEVYGLRRVAYFGPDQNMSEKMEYQYDVYNRVTNMLHFDKEGDTVVGYWAYFYEENNHSSNSYTNLRAKMYFSTLDEALAGEWQSHVLPEGKLMYYWVYTPDETTNVLMETLYDGPTGEVLLFITNTYSNDGNNNSIRLKKRAFYRYGGFTPSPINISNIRSLSNEVDEDSTESLTRQSHFDDYYAKSTSDDENVPDYIRKSKQYQMYQKMKTSAGGAVLAPPQGILEYWDTHTDFNNNLLNNYRFNAIYESVEIIVYDRAKDGTLSNRMADATLTPQFDATFMLQNSGYTYDYQGQPKVVTYTAQNGQVLATAMPVYEVVGTRIIIDTKAISDKREQEMVQERAQMRQLEIQRLINDESDESVDE